MLSEHEVETSIDRHTERGIKSGTSFILSFLLPLAISLLLQIPFVETWVTRFLDPLPTITSNIILIFAVFAPSYVVILITNESRRQRATVALLLTVLSVPYYFALLAISFVISCFLGNCL